jgi:hypothetical protein
MYPDKAQPIAQVVNGMTVVDRTGEEIGTVELVKMGDPESITTEGQQPAQGEGVVHALADSIFGAEPDVPGPLAARLLRMGYVKVDGKGLLETDRYVASDQIAGVDQDVVRLNVSKEELSREMA